MKATQLAALSNQALRRLLAYLDERLSTVQHNAKLYQRVSREWDAAKAEYESRVQKGVLG